MMKRVLIAFRLFLLGLHMERLRKKIERLVEMQVPLTDGEIVWLDKRFSAVSIKWFMLESKLRAV